MPWFMVDDKLHSHPKAVRAGVSAMGLWSLAGSWSADQLTDGFIPDYIAARIDSDSEAHAAELVKARLWHTTEKNGEPGWQFHEWENFQPTREAVEAKREAARERMARVRGNRKGGSQEVRANSEGSSQEVRLTPALPSPSQPDKATKPRKRGLPADWTPNTAALTFAKEKRIDADREAFKFRNHAASTGRTLIDWDRAFLNWLDKSLEYAPRTTQRSATDKRPEGW